MHLLVTQAAGVCTQTRPRRIFSVGKKFKYVLLSTLVTHHVLSLNPNGLFLRELRVNLLRGRQKRELHQKIHAVQSVEAKHSSKCDVWEKGLKKRRAVAMFSITIFKLGRFSIRGFMLKEVQRGRCVLRQIKDTKRNKFFLSSLLEQKNSFDQILMKKFQFQQKRSEWYLPKWIVLSEKHLTLLVLISNGIVFKNLSSKDVSQSIAFFRQVWYNKLGFNQNRLLLFTKILGKSFYETCEELTAILLS